MGLPAAPASSALGSAGVSEVSRDRYARVPPELERDLLAFAEDEPSARGTVAGPALECGSSGGRRRRAIAIGALALVAVAALGLGRELRGNTGTIVLLHSEPPGAEVYARRLQPEDLALEAPVLTRPNSHAGRARSRSGSLRVHGA
jgi:hypothetical protein